MPISYSIKIWLKIYLRQSFCYYITLSASKFLQNVIYLCLFYSFKHALVGFEYKLSHSLVLD